MVFWTEVLQSPLDAISVLHVKGSTSQSPQAECASCSGDTKECAPGVSNSEEDPTSRDPPSGASAPMMHIPSFLGPAMSCLNGASPIASSSHECTSSLPETTGTQGSEDIPHISPMIRFGTFAPGAVPGLDNGARSRKAESRAWRVLGKLGSDQALSAESSATGDPPVNSGGFMAPPPGCRTCLALGESPNGTQGIPNPPVGSGASALSTTSTQDTKSPGQRKKVRVPAQGRLDSSGQIPQTGKRAVHAEVLTLLVGALASADFDHDEEDGSEAESNDAESGEGTPSVPASGSNLQKISLLLSSAPVSLLPDVIMLVPMLLRPSEHTAVAGFLLGWLSEVGQRSPEIEQLVRPAVLSSLGPLKISAAVADKVVEAALKALPVCPAAEVPAAVVLILKLSSEHAGYNGAGIKGGVRGVREFLKTNAAGVSENIFVAVQLAVMRHTQICEALQADILAECEQLRHSGHQVQGKSEKCGPNPRSLVDTMVLMDMLRSGDKLDVVRSSIQQCISMGLISSSDISTVLDRRRMYHKFWRDMDRLPTAVGNNQDGSWNSEASTCDEEDVQSDLPISSDEFQALVGLIEYLLKSKDSMVEKFLNELCKFMFEMIGESPTHERLLQSLVNQAGSSKQGNHTSPQPVELLISVVEKFPSCATTSVLMLLEQLETRTKDLESAKAKGVQVLFDSKCN